VSNLILKGGPYSYTYLFFGTVTYNGDYYMISDASNGKSDNPSQHIIYEFDYVDRVTQELLDN